MSSLPGHQLEDFVTWYYRYDFAVDTRLGACWSVSAAEAIGTGKQRVLRLSEEQLHRVVRCFEPDRETVEYYLGDFEEDCMSWRDYSSYCSEWAEPQCFRAAEAVVALLAREASSEQNTSSAQT